MFGSYYTFKALEMIILQGSSIDVGLIPEFKYGRKDCATTPDAPGHEPAGGFPGPYLTFDESVEWWGNAEVGFGFTIEEVMIRCSYLKANFAIH